MILRTVALVVAAVALGCSSGDDVPEGEYRLPSGDAAEHPTAYIAVIVHDPPGDDLEPGGGEHVVIRNNADIRIDMGGWWVEAPGGVRLPLGIGRQIEPGAQLRVHVGQGEESEEAVFAGLERQALPPGGGTVVLRDAAGGEVMSVRYDD